MVLQLTSTAFAPGSRVPARYSCEGDDVSPPLAWSGVPTAAKSLVLLCDDPDAPAGTWHHWAVFNIPADQKGLAENLAKSARVGQIRQAINDFRRPGYGGPCPPPGHGPHHYHFRLMALNLATLELRDGARCVEVEKATRGHVVAEAELIGTYSRG